MKRLSSPIGRRAFLRRSAAGCTVIVASGCNPYFSPEDGEAFAPWDFPRSDYEDPRYVLVHAALLAANPHNTQPWIFELHDDHIDVYADEARSLGAMDVFHREMRVGVGCALENMVIAARSQGFTAPLQLLPEGPEGPAARLPLSNQASTREPLLTAIPERHTNRGAYADAPLPPGLVHQMRQLIADLAPVELIVREDTEGMEAFAEHTVGATEAINADPQMIEDSDRWFRHTIEDIEKYRDGTSTDAQRMGTVRSFFGKLIEQPSVDEGAEYWLQGTRRQVSTGSAFMFLSTPELLDRTQILHAGRAYQRLALWVQTQNLALQPLNQMAERRDREQELGLEPRYGEILRALSNPNGGQLEAQMLFRIGYPFDDAYRAPRRPVEWVVN